MGKKSSKKKLTSIIILAIIVLVLFLWFIKTPIMSAYISKKLKLDVSIGKVHMTPSHLKIKNFKIKNPEKTKSKNAFTCKKIEVDFSFSKIFSSPSIIDKISMEDIFIIIECDNALCTKNNWTMMVESVEQKEQKEEKKEVIIEKLILDDISVEVREIGLKKSKFLANISHIENYNVNSREGFPTQQLIAALFRSAGLKDYLKDIFEKQKFFENFLTPFKDLSENEAS